MLNITLREIPAEPPRSVEDHAPLANRSGTTIRTPVHYRRREEEHRRHPRRPGRIGRLISSGLREQERAWSRTSRGDPGAAPPSSRSQRASTRVASRTPNVGAILVER